MQPDACVVHHGDCLDVLRGMAEASVDAVITDPPYGLSDHKPAEVVACLTAWLAGVEFRPKARGGFMNRSWDAWVPGPEVWREVLRVLRPGGHVCVFAGTRSMDLMSMALRLAGFELRDSIGSMSDGSGAPLLAWVTGQGFPKSLDVGKAIHKRGGADIGWFGPWLRKERERRGVSQRDLCERCGFHGAVNHGGAVANWELGLNLPTVEQFNILRRVLSLPFARLEEAEREVLGMRVVNPGLAFTSVGPSELPVTAPATDAAKQWQGWGTALKPSWEPIVLARKPLAEPTVAANVLRHGTGVINVDACRVPTDESTARPVCGGGTNTEQWRTGKGNLTTGGAAGRWPANLVLSYPDDQYVLKEDVTPEQKRSLYRWLSENA